MTLLSTRIGRQTGARSGNAGQERADMVDAAGGHYLDYREFRVRVNGVEGGSEGSGECGVWRVEWR
jgi:hypothetical protein